VTRLKLPDLAFLAAVTPEAGANVVTSGLQLYVDAGNSSSYPGSGTTWADLSTNSRDCTLTGGPSYSSADGGSFYFAGPNSGEYAQMSGSISTGAAGATFFAFMKRDGENLNYNGLIFSRGSGGSTGGMNTIDSGNQTALGYHWYGSVQAFSNLKPSNLTWTMVAVTFGSDQAIGYMGTSGGITSQTVAQSTGSATLADVEIAGNHNFANRYFKGYISVAMIYDRSLSSTEITQNFDAFKSRYGY
jgi:hypothetical protein